MEAARSPYYAQHPGFASTHWTTIRACSGDDDAACAARAELCRDYWYPVYAYIRRQNHALHYAEDLTQDFFAHILKRPWFVRADQSRGKFRTFLLASLDNFLRDEFSRKNARKRDGSYQHIPHDLHGVEVPSAQGTAATVQPVEMYETDWAFAIVAATLRQLEAEHSAEGQGHQYSQLKIYLTTLGDAGHYEATATELNRSVPNVKVMVHRLRKRYGAILKERVAMTVAVPEDVEDEMRHMRAVLAAC